MVGPPCDCWAHRPVKVLHNDGRWYDGWLTAQRDCGTGARRSRPRARIAHSPQRLDDFSGYEATAVQCLADDAAMNVGGLQGAAGPERGAASAGPLQHPRSPVATRSPPRRTRVSVADPQFFRGRAVSAVACRAGRGQTVPSTRGYAMLRHVEVHVDDERADRLKSLNALCRPSSPASVWSAHATSAELGPHGDPVVEVLYYPPKAS